MKKSQEFPAVPQALLIELERRFPDKSPSRTDSDRDILINIGQAEVIRFLRKQFNEQNKNVPSLFQ